MDPWEAKDLSASAREEADHSRTRLALPGEFLPGRRRNRGFGPLNQRRKFAGKSLQCILIIRKQ